MRSTKKNQQSGGQAEIIAAVKALASEKDISEEMLYNAIEEALKAAYKKNVSREENAPTNLSVTLDRTTGVAQVFARKTITDEVEDPANQISLEDALKIRSDYRMGDIAEIDVTPTGFLRTAAQTAKQVIMQRIREAEQGKIYDEYSEKENEILTAIVQRVEPKGVYVELGRTEGILPDSEWMPGEEYHIDDHIKVYVLEVNRTGREMLRGPQVRVSRIHPGLVKRLFEMEVPEIAAGVVQIKSIAREAGSRTKMAVHSTEVTIDPVGACVGPRGNRVEKVVAELKNEKIDIIEWDSDPAVYIAPAQPGHRQGGSERPPGRQAHRLAHRHQEPEPGCSDVRHGDGRTRARGAHGLPGLLRRARAPGGAAPVRPAGAARYSPGYGPRRGRHPLMPGPSHTEGVVNRAAKAA